MEPQRDTSKRFKLGLATVVASLVCLASFPSPYDAAAQEPLRPKGVLTLYGGEKGNPANAAIEKSIQAFLGSAPAGSVEYYAEYLEDTRFPGESQSLLMRDLMRQRYGDGRIDVIMATSSTALNFLLKYRRDILPNVPVVFHAFNRADADKRGEVNGVPIVDNGIFRNTIDLALKLHPDTQQALIITGTPGHDKRIEAEVRKELKEFDNRENLKLNYLTDLPLDELITRVKSAPARSIVLYVRYSQEELGKTLDVYNSLTLIADAAKVPVYSALESLIGHGSIGGYAASFEDCSRMAT